MNTLTLHYQRPIDEKSPIPYRAWEGEREIEAGNFHQRISDFDTWDAWACTFDRVVSFASLSAHTQPQIERNRAFQP
jgi:hypothetical protein